MLCGTPAGSGRGAVVVGKGGGHTSDICGGEDEIPPMRDLETPLGSHGKSYSTGKPLFSVTSAKSLSLAVPQFLCLLHGGNDSFLGPSSECEAGLSDGWVVLLR